MKKDLNVQWKNLTNQKSHDVFFDNVHRQVNFFMTYTLQMHKCLANTVPNSKNNTAKNKKHEQKDRMLHKTVKTLQNNMDNLACCHHGKSLRAIPEINQFWSTGAQRNNGHNHPVTNLLFTSLA